MVVWPQHEPLTQTHLCQHRGPCPWHQQLKNPTVSFQSMMRVSMAWAPSEIVGSEQRPPRTCIISRVAHLGSYELALRPHPQLLCSTVLPYVVATCSIICDKHLFVHGACNVTAGTGVCQLVTHCPGSP